MRLLHTSDWHLGHTLHERDRDAEHAAFLAWLLDQLEAHAVDALLITGDVFDTSNPSALAQARLYGFLDEAHRRLPELDVVVIGGNHDSAARLDAPHPVLKRLGVHVVGGLPVGDRALRTLDMERLVVPLRGPGGDVEAWCVAVPFLRTAELPVVEGEEDPLIAGVREVYRQVIDAAQRLRQPGQAVVALGHCYMSGSDDSRESERPILVGNQHALPVDLFGDDVSYVALGHLHRPQRVSGRDTVRYAGSPIPLALVERTYLHQVLRVDLHEGAVTEILSLRVPRSVEVLRVPDKGAARLPEVLRALAALPDREEGSERSTLPFLEVEVEIDAPEPTLQRQIHDAIVGKAARLARLKRSYGGSGEALGDVTTRKLGDLQVSEVFGLAWRRAYKQDAPEELLKLLEEITDTVRQEGP